MALSRGRRERAGVLPCGWSVDSLWERMRRDAQPDGHVAGCGHCRPVLDGLHVLDLAKRELVSERVDAPPTLLQRVMRAVRTEYRRGPTAPRVAGPEPTRVEPRAVAAAAAPHADVRRP